MRSIKTLAIVLIIGIAFTSCNDTVKLDIIEHEGREYVVSSNYIDYSEVKSKSTFVGAWEIVQRLPDDLGTWGTLFEIYQAEEQDVCYELIYEHPVVRIKKIRKGGDNYYQSFNHRDDFMYYLRIRNGFSDFQELNMSDSRFPGYFGRLESFTIGSDGLPNFYDKYHQSKNAKLTSEGVEILLHKSSPELEFLQERAYNMEQELIQDQREWERQLYEDTDVQTMYLD